MPSGSSKNGATGEFANKRMLLSLASSKSCRPMRILRLKWPSPTLSGEYMAMLQPEVISQLPFLCQPEDWQEPIWAGNAPASYGPWIAARAVGTGPEKEKGSTAPSKVGGSNTQVPTAGPSDLLGGRLP